MLDLNNTNTTNTPGLDIPQFYSTGCFITAGCLVGRKVAQAAAGLSFKAASYVAQYFQQNNTAKNMHALGENFILLAKKDLGGDLTAAGLALASGLTIMYLDQAFQTYENHPDYVKPSVFIDPRQVQHCKDYSLAMEKYIDACKKTNEFLSGRMICNVPYFKCFGFDLAQYRYEKSQALLNTLVSSENLNGVVSNVNNSVLEYCNISN
ncbi:MAG TPA: hypothetical protein VGP47_11580 [Parachlamydiaceae bacterium]|nr:hypothetical protein [Parachlamydiaceae bacterium]